MDVKFLGEMKNCDAKRFISGDYGARVTIYWENPDPALLAKLNAIFASDVNQKHSLMITISDGVEAP